MPTLFKQLQTARDHEPEPPGRPVTKISGRSTSMGSNRTSQARVEARREFLRTTNKGSRAESYTNPESLPSLDVAYDDFQRIYPKFAETLRIDDLRQHEYSNLKDSQHVCMDYCGFGLFSYYQQVINKASSSFGLAYISANLPTHALYGAAEEGTVESHIRKRVMDYLNINETEYAMVFTASRGSAFKLLAESYPFHLNPKLLTVYDFESEAVNWMGECAKQKGAKIMSAGFKWPTLRIGTSDLKKQLQEKKKKNESAKGLFVFPVQSRMTGAKYSLQWMSQAQQHKWHVLLDASALGPKDMDSLGLSLFRPDFIVSSFYKVFGTDPTGFGCLFIKNSVIQSLHNSSRARAVGMVRIVSMNTHATDEVSVKESEDDAVDFKLQNHLKRLEIREMDATSSFSGPYFMAAKAELKTGDSFEGHNQQAAKPRKTKDRNATDSERCGHLTRSSRDSRTRRSEIEEDEIEYASQLTKSRCYSERRASEIQDEVTPGSGAGHNELQELEDRLSEVENCWRLSNSWDTAHYVDRDDDFHHSVDLQGLREDDFHHSLELQGLRENDFHHNLELQGLREGDVHHNLELQGLREDGFHHNLELQGLTEDDFHHNLDLQGLRKDDVRHNLELQGLTRQENSGADGGNREGAEIEARSESGRASRADRSPFQPSPKRGVGDIADGSADRSPFQPSPKRGVGDIADGSADRSPFQPSPKRGVGDIADGSADRSPFQPSPKRGVGDIADGSADRSPFQPSPKRGVGDIADGSADRSPFQPSPKRGVGDIADGSADRSPFQPSPKRGVGDIADGSADRSPFQPSPKRGVGDIADGSADRSPFQPSPKRGVGDIADGSADRSPFQPSPKRWVGDIADGSADRSPFHPSPKRGVGDIEEDVMDLGESSLAASIQVLSPEVFDAVEKTDWDMTCAEDLQLDARLDRRKSEIEEVVDLNEIVGEPVNTASGDARPRTDTEDFANLNNREASLDSKPEENNKGKRREISHKRLQSFPGGASFRRHTGRSLSDFQEMGVLGLVKRFQGLKAENGPVKQLESIKEQTLDIPTRKQDAAHENRELVPGKSASFLRALSEGKRSRSPPPQVGKARREDLDSHFVHPEQSTVKAGVGLKAASGIPVGRDRSITASEVSKAGEVLANENTLEDPIRSDDSLYLRQRLSTVGQCERGRELDGTNVAMVAAPAEGENDQWSRNEVLPQECSTTVLPQTSGGGKSSFTPCSNAYHVMNQEPDLSKSPAEGAKRLPLRRPSFSFSLIEGRVDESLDRDEECDLLARKEGISWRPQEARALSAADSRSGTAPANPFSREVSLLDGSGMSNVGVPEHIQSPHSVSFRVDECGTPYESGEENYITLLPSRSGKDWTNGRPDLVSDERASGSHELSDKETCYAIEKEMGKEELVPIQDDFSSPEQKHGGHVGDNGRLAKSPAVAGGSGRSSLCTPVHEIDSSETCRTVISYRRGRSIDNASFDAAEFQDAEEQSWGNGRSDLRSNRTLSRDVDFEDETFSGRGSSVSDMFISRRSHATLAQDLAQIDMQNSDEESYFQAHYYSKSLQRSSTSRYVEDDSPSYGQDREAEVGGSGEFEDILAPVPDASEGQGESSIVCRGLDFADSLGLTKVNYRLRYLINWLVNSLLKLRHPGASEGISLVRIYGPKVKYDRGAAVSFNMFDWKGVLIQPGLVQRLADRSNISLGVGRLCNIVDPDMSPDFMAEKERFLGADRSDLSADQCPYPGRSDNLLRIPVVTAALSFVTSFEDVYKLWSFLAKFLDADFVSKEGWRYHSLNQQTVVM